jgi:DNA invertase Pin-like site-specific DNA recombinase
MSKKTIVAARYVRNSDPSKKDSEVFKAQAEALTEYAKKMGYECPDHLLYADAISALKYPYWERSDLMRLWDDAERGEFDIVLCTEFIRLARKSSEQYAIMEYLKRFHVTVESITEKFEDTAEGHLLHAVQGFLGEVEAEKIRIRTLRGKQHRATKALTGQGSTPTYGYVWIDGAEYKKERYELNLTVIAVVNGEVWTEVKVILFCYESCLKGVSLRQIAMKLTQLGIPTRMRKDAWDLSTVRQILKNENYTGTAYNGKWTRDENGKFSRETHIKLPDGIYPKIIEPERFEKVQRQLVLNSEMAIRNNPHPEESLLRGLAFCGVCGKKLHCKHRNEIRKGRKTLEHSEYCCYTHTGAEDALNHHYAAITFPLLDSMAWDFAVPYIKNPQRIRQHIDAMRGQVMQRDHSQDLEKEIERINKSVTNLYKLAEAANPDDEEGMQALQNRLNTLQHDKREKERLFNGIVDVEDKQGKLLAALDRFEAWATTVRPFLDDPTYVLSFADKREALLILGVKATLWPSQGYEKRTHLELSPPDIARFCDCDFDRQ